MASLEMDSALASSYSSLSQQARVVTENWVVHELYCPSCSRRALDSVGKPLLDFQCNNCEETFELKSRSSPFAGTIIDSAYSVKMKQIAAGTNPSFLFLHYEPSWRVANLFAVPKHIFHPGLIQPRKPLGPTHPRAGHILSTIQLHRIPPEARVHIIQHRAWRPQAHIQQEWQTLTSFGKVKHTMRGWTLDVYNQIRQLPTEFSLQEAYTSEEALGRLHPENKHIKPKIRQQLQVLRDIGLLEFKGRGIYKLRRRTHQTKLQKTAFSSA